MTFTNLKILHLFRCKFHLILLTLIIPGSFVSELKGEDDVLTTHIYDPAFHTLTVIVNDNLMNPPVIGLDSPQQLVFSFDEIADDRSYLRCRLIHCNADWIPSRLVENEYVEGFNEAEISDIGFSNNTFIRYVNYRFTLGTDGLRPLVSGNYIWQVYDEGNPDEILLQARFRVTENKTLLSAVASGRTDKGFNDNWQQLEVEAIIPSDLNINRYTDLILVIEQNNHPESARQILHPMRVEGSKVIYEHLPQLVFPAGNEYRRFETVRNNYPGMGVDSTAYIPPMYQAYLSPSFSRASHEYIYDSTQHGRFKIDEYNSTDPDLGADYIMTHFSLDFPELMDADIYVDGELFLNGFSDANRMKYDRESGLYRLSAPLKQGSYNFRYAVKKRDGDISPHSSLIEGDLYQTINEYNLYIYLRYPGLRADRLLGASTIYARP